MQIARLNQWLGRFPALKRFLVRLASLVPALDMRLRKAAHEARHARPAMQVDAAHLPEDAASLLRRMKRGTADGSRR